MTADNASSRTQRIAEIDFEPVELCKLLKNEDLAQSGGEAKFVISEGLVKVNGLVETRKRKKIHDGDIVAFNGQQIQVRLKSR